MRRIWLLLLMLIISVPIGCAPSLKTNAVVKFDTPSSISVIGSKSKVLLTSLNNYGYKNSPQFLKDIKTEINQAKYFQAVLRANYKVDKTASHLMNIDNFMVYRADNSKQKIYNKQFIKVTHPKRDKRGNEIGGYESIEKKDAKSSTATLITTVTIYDTRNLEPLAYFNIVSTDCDWRKWEEDIADKHLFEKGLRRQIVAKLKDLVTRDRKGVGVIIPDNCDRSAKQLLLNSDYQGAKSRLKILLPQESILVLSPREVIKKYEQWAREVEIAKKEGRKGILERDMEQDLRNYYLYLMAEEARNISPGNLRSVHMGYTNIVALTEDNSLIEACAHSLGRLEIKAERIEPGMLRPEQPSVFALGATDAEAAITPDKTKTKGADLKKKGERTKTGREGLVLIGVLSSKKPTIGHILFDHFRSWNKVKKVLTKNSKRYSDKYYRRLRPGSRVFIKEDGEMEIEPSR